MTNPDAPRDKPSRCSACGSADLKQTFEVEAETYWRCNFCGHFWSVPKPPRVPPSPTGDPPAD